jgi:hypothetical protein
MSSSADLKVLVQVDPDNRIVTYPTQRINRVEAAGAAIAKHSSGVAARFRIEVTRRNTFEWANCVDDPSEKSVGRQCAKGAAVVAAAMLALTCAACTALPGDSMNGLVTAVNKGSAALVADLKAADVDALAHNDSIADQCYKAEIEFIQGLPQLPNSSTLVGPVQLFQIKRDVQNVIDASGAKSLKIRCAPLWVDEQDQFLKFSTFLAEIGIVLPK